MKSKQSDWGFANCVGMLAVNLGEGDVYDTKCVSDARWTAK